MKNLIFTILLFASFNSFCQISTIDIGKTNNPNDSTFFVQYGQTDSFHHDNHPNAGPYFNSEILVCENATLIYNYAAGTSSNPTFYLESGATLKIVQTLFDFKIYMKANAVLDLNNQASGLVKSNRINSASIINDANAFNMTDSVFTAVNFTYNTWNSMQGPCLLSTAVNDLSNEKNLFSISPNPANEYLNINGNFEEIKEIKINNLLGQEVLNTTFKFKKINISNLHKGIYFISIKTKNDFFQKIKFVKE